MKRIILTLIAFVQLIHAVRLIERLMRTSRGTTIRPGPHQTDDRVSVLVPVLNEADRLTPCLEGLIATGPEIADIVVIDGGSSDATADIVRKFQRQDRRIRLIETTPPAHANGKAHGLSTGLKHVCAAWVLTIDADARPQPALVAALLATAERERVNVLSVATNQWLADRLDQIVHPAMLTTLIYRFGIPGQATSDPNRVQANGQCQLIRRDLLERLGGYDRYAQVIAEDVALARDAARLGERVGFYEAPDLISVEMYSSGLETIQNWSRSLPLVGGSSGRYRRDLAMLALLQAAPLPIVLACRNPRSFAFRFNAFLLVIRLGVLAGSRRAYCNSDRWYWLSPLADLPAVIVLIINSRRRTHRWRGRTIRQGGA